MTPFIYSNYKELNQLIKQKYKSPNMKKKILYLLRKIQRLESAFFKV